MGDRKHALVPLPRRRWFKESTRRFTLVDPAVGKEVFCRIQYEPRISRFWQDQIARVLVGFGWFLLFVVGIYFYARLRRA